MREKERIGESEKHKRGWTRARVHVVENKCESEREKKERERESETKYNTIFLMKI
jgi:hypothetical protein